MKFNTVNEMVGFANITPRTKSGNIKSNKFKIAYVELCRHKRVPLTRYAKLINVAKTTPYSWKALCKLPATIEDAYAVFGNTKLNWANIDTTKSIPLILECIQVYPNATDKVGDLVTGSSAYDPKYYRKVCTREEYEEYVASNSEPTVIEPESDSKRISLAFNAITQHSLNEADIELILSLSQQIELYK